MRYRGVDESGAAIRRMTGTEMTSKNELKLQTEA